MNATEYRNARKPDSFGVPATPVKWIASAARHRSTVKPSAAFEIGRWSIGRGCDYRESASVDVESPTLAGLSVKVTVGYDDDCRESLEDTATNADYKIEKVGRYRPDEDEPDRPDRCAILVDVGGRDVEYWWVWLPEDYRTTGADGSVVYRRHFDLPGASRSVRQEYSDTKRKAAAQAMADHLRALAEDRISSFYVTLTASCNGEEVYCDSLGGIEAEGGEEAARYFFGEGGIDNMIHACADWRREHAAALARQASTLAARAADLLSPRDDS